MIFNWPENLLPLPAPDFTVDENYSVVKSRMDSGRRRLRPRYTKALSEASVRFECTKEEYAYFVAIWKHKLNNGTDWFMMRLPAPDKQTLTLQQIRFVSDYRADHKSFENWDISVEIEFFEQSGISEDQIEAVLRYGLDYEEALADDLNGIDNIFPKDWEL